MIIKVTLICERCGVNHEENINFRGSAVVFEIDEVGKFEVVDLDGKLHLLCPYCIEKLGEILDEESKKRERKIQAFLHQEA